MQTRHVVTGCVSNGSEGEARPSEPVCSPGAGALSSARSPTLSAGFWVFADLPPALPSLGPPWLSRPDRGHVPHHLPSWPAISQTQG